MISTSSVQTLNQTYGAAIQDQIGHATGDLMASPDEGIENPLEQPGYLDLSGEHLYVVLHGATKPIARVLLVGPFASERHYSYIPWVRWARFLAARNIEVLRYDYRGIGESSGMFREMALSDWCEDVTFLATWLEDRTPEVPLVIHGLELGALLASKTFTTGLGDALLAWAAPTNANDVLRTALLRRITVDRTFKGMAEHRAFSDYVRQLDTEPIEVDGYQLSGNLWRESLEFETPLVLRDEPSAAESRGRPVRSIPLDKSAAPLVKGSTMGYLSVNPDLSELFSISCEWITKAAGVLA